MIVVVSGHPSVDRLYEVDELRRGAIHRPAPPVVVAGGKGLNVARAVHTLGADVRVVAILAGHSGRWIAETLQATGIAGSYVWGEGETRMSVSIADRSRPESRLTEFYEGSHPIDLQTWSSLEEGAQEALTDADLLCLSGSLIAGAPPDGYRRLTELAHRAGVTVAVDSHGTYLLRAIEASPDLIKVNAEEAGEALGVTPPADNLLSWSADAAQALRVRAGAGSACLITAGADGMALADPSGNIFCGHLEHFGKFPVGSGDAALAALTIAMTGKRSWPSALASALGAAGANASTPGPGLLKQDEANALTARAVVELIDPELPKH